MPKTIALLLLTNSSVVVPSTKYTPDPPLPATPPCKTVVFVTAPGAATSASCKPVVRFTFPSMLS